MTSTTNIQLYGSDIYLDDNGDIKLTPQDEFKTTEGIDNLIQAIKSRLRTVLNELELHPNYGSTLSGLIGKKSITSNLISVRQLVRKTLLQEPRIKENGIKKINTFYPDESDRTKIEVSISVIPIDSQVELNIIYGVTV